MGKEIRIDMEPFSAIRSTRKGKFNERSQAYHDKKQILELKIGRNKKDIINALIEGNYELLFFHEIPESFSKKKKERLQFTPKQTKPDGDNLFKAFTDTVFYNSGINDSKIWNTSSKKFYAPVDSKGYIIFKILD